MFFYSHFLLQIKNIYQNKMSVIIRHGPKQWSNGKGPHDNPSLKIGESETILEKTVEKLLKQGFIPNTIITSPYYRTIETSNILKNHLNRLNINVNILIDDDLREYIKGKCPRVQGGCDIPCKYESEKEFTSRTMNIKKKKYWLNQNVWLVTHRPLIKKLTGINHLDCGRYVILK